MSTQPANNPSDATLYPDGFVAVPRDLVEHMQSGKMTAAMFSVYFVILQQCDWATGVWNGNAHRIYHALGGSMSLSEIRKQMAKLCRQLFVKSFHFQGRKGNYFVLIDGYIPTLGDVRGRVLNATASTSWTHPVYEDRSEREVTSVSAGSDEHVRRVSAGSEPRPYQDNQDFQDFQNSQNVQEGQEVKTPSPSCASSRINTNTSGQVEALATALSEIAEESRELTIVFDNNRKSALSSLLKQYSSDEIESAWEVYLDKQVDGSEFSVSHAARLFTEVADQIISVLRRRSQREQESTENVLQ